MNKVRKIFVGILCISLIGGLAYLNTATGLKKTSKADYSPDAFKIEKCNYSSTRDTVISMKNNKYGIKRTSNLYDAKDDENGYWTFLVYLSGNADESKNGVCSKMLDSMVKASENNSKIKFIVCTGGASKWKKEKDKEDKTPENKRFNMSYKKIQLYMIKEGSVYPLSKVVGNQIVNISFPAVHNDNDKLFVTSMGNPDVLCSFLQNALSGDVGIVVKNNNKEEFKSETAKVTTVKEEVIEEDFSDVIEDKDDNTENNDNNNNENQEEKKEVKTVDVTYNNHIGLFIYGNNDAMDKGVAYDENCKDYLTASELELALNASKGSMGNKLDLVCFDGTTSQYVEVANMLAPYSEYLVGPQCKGGYGGVKYEMVAGNIGLGYTKTTYEVASDLCETSYSASNDAVKKKVVLSAIDLRNMDTFLKRFHSTLSKLNAMIETKPEEFIKYSAAMNKAAVTTDKSVDLGNFLRKIGPKIDGISYTYSSYNRMISNKVAAVRYGVNKDATGLSVYWNMKATDADYNFIKNNSVNPYLLNIMDASMYIGDKTSLDKYSATRKKWDESKDYYSSNFKFVDKVANGRIGDK